MAELVVTGGTIRPLDPAAPDAVADSLAIRDGRVVALGGREVAAGFPGVPRLELAGRTVVPGLVDSHCHLLALGAARRQVALGECESFEDLVERVRAAAVQAPAGSFVQGFGWNETGWPDASLHHAVLSRAVPDHPVLLRRADDHAVLANARAMELAGIGRDVVVPPDGEVPRDASGEPTGLFVDGARRLLPAPPRADAAEHRADLLDAQARFLERGLVGGHDVLVDEPSLATLRRAGADGSLVLRVDGWLQDGLEASVAPGVARGVAPGATWGRFRVAGVKLFADGALGSRGAWLSEDYADRPGWRGLACLDADALRARVRSLHAAGWSAAVHAIGDAAVTAALDAFESAGGPAPLAPPRVEHAQVIAERDFARFAPLGVVAAVQPIHAVSDRQMARRRLPERLAAGAYAWSRLARAGATIALGSDAPIESECPWAGLAAATAAQRDEERLTPLQALAGYTTGAALAAGRPAASGSLTLGQAADFLVLARDPLTLTDDQVARLRHDQVAGLRPDETWVAGRCAFRRDADG